MRRLIPATLFVFLTSSTVYASAYNFVDTNDDRSLIQRYLEPFLIVVTAYHVQATPHEAVHASVAYSFGTKTKYWTIKPMLQSVSYDRENSERSNEDIFFTSMSAPVFSRATANLPRWIYAPSGPGYWSRWTGGYWIMSTTSTWVTMAGAWIAYVDDDEDAGWDFNNASRAISNSKKGQAAFLSGLTLLLSADLFWNWSEYLDNFSAFSGRKAVVAVEKDDLSLRLIPNGLELTYKF